MESSNSNTELSKLGYTETSSGSHLVFNHELVTLHHQLEFVPLGSQTADCLHPAACHSSQKPVFVFSFLKQGQNLRIKKSNGSFYQALKILLL